MALKLSTARHSLKHLQTQAGYAAQQRWIDEVGGQEAVQALMRGEMGPMKVIEVLGECAKEGEQVGREQYDAQEEARYAEAAEKCGKKMGECSRCSGSGKVIWAFANGRCFDCNGLGWVKA